MDKVRTIIAGVGHYLPPHVVSSEEIERTIKPQLNFFFPEGTIARLSGVRERRYVTDGKHPSDLALEASKMALEDAGVLPEEVDTIIFAACTKDIGEPATANILQEKLKAYNAAVFDAQNACNSFVNAVDIMDSFIRTGKTKIGLVATGELLSPFINWDIRKKKDMETGFAGLTLGDGAGAVVLRASEDKERGIESTLFESVGSLWRLATVMGCGTVAPRDPQASYFFSHSKELLKFALERIPKIVERILKLNNWSPKDVDIVFSHQASEPIIKKICKLVKIPVEKCQYGLREYGNTGAASIPIGLSGANRKGLLKEGDKILLVGGASGFSSGAISLIW